MLTEYFEAAMRQASYEIQPEDGEFYGEIPACQGVWSTGKTLEACRAEMRSALEDLVLFSIHWHFPLPVIDGLEIKVHEQIA